MTSTLLSMLLSLQILFSTTDQSPALRPHTMVLTPHEQVEINRVWWGMTDPETSLWFSRIPSDDPQPRTPVIWDFSWRGFLAALFGPSIIQEAPHAPLA